MVVPRWWLAISASSSCPRERRLTATSKDGTPLVEGRRSPRPTTTNRRACSSSIRIYPAFRERSAVGGRVRFLAMSLALGRVIGAVRTCGIQRGGRPGAADLRVFWQSAADHPYRGRVETATRCGGVDRARDGPCHRSGRGVRPGTTESRRRGHSQTTIRDIGADRVRRSRCVAVGDWALRSRLVHRPSAPERIGTAALGASRSMSSGGQAGLSDDRRRRTGVVALRS